MATKRKKTVKKSKPKAKKASKAKRPAKAKSSKKSTAKKTKTKASSKKAKKAAPRKSAATQAPKGVIAPVGGILLGYVDDYFAKIGVVALVLERPLAIGSRIHILGHTTNFDQVVDSMQIDHAPVTNAAAKSGVGIKVTTRARKGDHVYLIP